MGKSIKKPIVKDRGMKKLYHKVCRRRNRTKLLSQIKFNVESDKDQEIEQLNNKSIINDYDYCDYILNFEDEIHKKNYYSHELRKYTRK